MQLAYDLVAGGLVHVQIGDYHQAETFVGRPGRVGDLLIGDRGDGIRRNLLALSGMQAAALLRFSPNHCHLEQADGTPLVVHQWLSARLSPYDAAKANVWMKRSNRARGISLQSALAGDKEERVACHQC